MPYYVWTMYQNMSEQHIFIGLSSESYCILTVNLTSFEQSILQRLHSVYYNYNYNKKILSLNNVFQLWILLFLNNAAYYIWTTYLLIFKHLTTLNKVSDYVQTKVSKYLTMYKQSINVSFYVQTKSHSILLCTNKVSKCLTMSENINILDQ